MSKHFITFGGGTFSPKGEWEAVAKRLGQEAMNTQLFDEVVAYTEEDLKSDKNFWSSHSEFIEKNKRGYGYWLWKPYLIGKTMRGMKEGDVLLYLDAGCEIDVGNESKKQYMENCTKAVEEEKILGTTAGKVHPERKWTKMDLPLHLGIADEPYMKEPQRQSGAVMYSVCDEVRGLVNDWYSLCCDYHLIDDSPSVSRNYEQFREHRHDQAVFSQLAKKYGPYSNRYSLHQCVEMTRCKKTS